MKIHLPWRRTPELWIERAELDRIEAVANKALPYETGGVLIGTQSKQRVWLLTALQVRAPQPHQSRYTLTINDANTALTRYLDGHQLPAEIGYVGTWHTHPHNIGPSQQDLTTVTQDSKTQQQQATALILARRSPDDWLPHGVIADRSKARITNINIDRSNPTRQPSV